MHLTDLTEARRKPVPAAPVDAAALLERIKLVAHKVASHPIGLDWNFEAGNLLKAQVDKAVAAHAAVMADEDEPMSPLDERDLYIEYLPKVYDHLSIRTFATVKREVEAEERDYQRRHGARMADEAGHGHDMQYVESSDWLSAMTMQARTAKLLDGYDMRSLALVEGAVKLLEDFATGWADAHNIDDEPILVEGMHGLAGIVPLLALVVKKSL